MRQSVFLAAALLGGIAMAPAFAHDSSHGTQIAQSEAEITIGATKLNDTLSMLSGVGGFTGGNVLVSNGPDGMLIVDDKLESMSEKLNAALSAIGDASALKFVLNTHWHFDHTGNNAELGKTATIIAHDNVRRRMSTHQRIDAFQMDLPPAPASALPVITYADSASVHFNGEELRLIHMPNSHTDTDSVVYFTQSNVLHTGDLFFNGIFPFIDIQNGGDVLSLTANVERMILMFPPDVTIVPGHGALATMDDLKVYLRMLKETTGIVQAHLASGKSLDEIQAAGLPAEWESYAWMIDVPTFISIIHASLTK